MDPTQTRPEARFAGQAEVGLEGRIVRGFRLARVSWEVLASDRRLLLLPLMASVCALGALVATATLAQRLHSGPDVMQVIAPIWIAAYLISFTTIVVERHGPVRSLRRSAQLVRVRWVEGLSPDPPDLAAARRRGSGLSGATTIGLTTLMVLLPVAGLLLIGCALYVTGLVALGLLAMASAGVAAVCVWIVSVALTQVFSLAVFQHATGGPCFEGFPARDLEHPRDGSSLGALRRLRVRRS